MEGELLIRWTARLAVVCYVGRLLCDVRRPQTPALKNAAMCWWTVGCAIFMAHVTAAFHFQHAWNHAEAFNYTARRTAEMTGWNSGTGLYINEAFLCLWIADTTIWWWKSDWPQNRIAYWTVQSIFAFLMTQATAVFGPPLWKPVALLVVAGLWFQSMRRDRTP